MGANLCCLRVPDDEAPGCFFSCLPWPPFLNNSHDAAAAARQRADTPLQGSVALAGSGLEEDSTNTFRCPPPPLPYDDPQSIRQMERRPLVLEAHDRASTQSQKSNRPDEINNADISSARAAEKAQSSQGGKIGGTQVDVPCDCEDECPICLEEYDYENPKMELQCSHGFHLCCVYEWMERSQSCPLCARIMVFNEDQQGA